MTKEQILKLIESRIDAITELASESIELIYNAGYNEGIEAAINLVGPEDKKHIRKLKK